VFVTTSLFVLLLFAVSVWAQLASDRRQTHSRLLYLPHAERSADTCNMHGSDATEHDQIKNSLAYGYGYAYAVLLQAA
jgi:hypothetical protein